MTIRIRKLLIASSAIPVLALGAGNVYAQEVPATEGTPQAEDARSTSLSDIIVTAQRRGENVQKVPISISAFNADSLAQAGISSAKDLQILDPSLNITGHSGSVLPFLRGIGNPSATTIGNEASVPVYIDEVYYTRVSPAYLELANVERVEVLKGPQGTLFGRNASGGLIHIVTRDPDMHDLQAEATAGYSNYNTFTGKLYLSVPVADNVAWDISASGRHQGDGWGRNQTTGADTYKDRFASIRSKLAINLTPTTEVRLSLFYVNEWSSKINLQTRYKGTVGGTPLLYGPAQPRPSLADSGRFFDTINDENTFDKFESWGGALKIKQELGSVDLVSITSYRKANETWHVDGDGTELPYTVFDSPSIDREVTQELQLKSQSGSAFDWIVGGFYLDSKQGYTPVSITGDQNSFIGASAVLLASMQRIHSYSAYGQATFHVIPDGTNVTLGLRYTSDKVHGTGGTFGVFPVIGEVPFGPLYDKSFKFNKLTYKVAVDHEFAQDIMGYVSISRGYKSGTFNTLPLNADPSNPEVIDAYEAGVKATLFDRKLRLNIAIFQNDIKDPQVQTVITDPSTGSSFVGLTNAKSARSRGIEADLQAVLADGLQFRLGGVLLDAKYTDFKNGPVAFPVVDANGVPVAPYGLYPLTTQDQSGNRIAQVPKARFTAGLNYDITTSAGRFGADVNMSYTSEFPWEPDGIIRQRAYALLGASLEWSPASSDRFSARIWGKNLTNKKYYATQLEIAGSQQGNSAIAAEPRTFGIEFRYKM
ncbi:TonB-dependent receptor [Sphingobium sp. H39-3-25]|uniref:TonB-dependent receptor n=1 Tax=Sphingobium arseniciresistens TaxID=3030834 RepID=UPI0023B9F81E|nr:TonB-dependent receptor [Sphingobium arseniciresistens]